ncbi:MULTISPECIES: hypothetical protein [unclassified Sinorhizobium]|uniref:hypothetical protein n=1 Tax=unclassified Sinorhizobium TaxID=2613772 RepID=UPI0035258DEF
MRDWFPLSNYEFYAFVSSGMLLIAAVDYCFTGGILVGRTDWTVVQAIFWTVVSYVLGQICAAPSSALVEFMLAHGFFRSPSAIALGIGKRRWRDYVAAWMFANREYAPLAKPVQDRIKNAASSKLNVPAATLTTDAIFQVAFQAAREKEDSIKRLESFQNNYGFCRNICFVGVIASAMLGYRYYQQPTEKDFWILIAAIVTAIGMFGRFLKYYSAYARQVLTAYSHSIS